MRDRLIRQRMRDRVIVTLDEGTSFEGVLYEVDGKSVVLREARLHTGSEPAPVDGEVILPRSRVLYLQRP